MRLITNEEIVLVSGGADSPSQGEKEKIAEELKKKLQKRVCDDLAEKAWKECQKNTSCRLLLNEETVKDTVRNECRNSFNKN